MCGNFGKLWFAMKLPAIISLCILERTSQIFDAKMQFNHGCNVGNVIFLSLQK
jgi:hypothetical protein